MRRLSNIRAAEMWNVFSKNERSRMRIARLTGGRNMASVGVKGTGEVDEDIEIIQL